MEPLFYQTSVDIPGVGNIGQDIPVASRPRSGPFPIEIIHSLIKWTFTSWLPQARLCLDTKTGTEQKAPSRSLQSGSCPCNGTGTQVNTCQQFYVTHLL